ncbi:hypothetical protein [Haladaptatus sp. CMSO5]|uniref:hypothetical protein n=1 Tax=Haladaptatus sp. CMSO5 TaxID=3120514 RepID=UPI002FCE00C3
MRRLGATLAVVLLLVTAGCSGFLGDDSTQGFTATPVDVPTDEPTPTPTEIVPGIGEEGVFDAERVVAAHEAALNEQSITVRIETSEQRPSGQTGERDTHERSAWVYIGADRDRFHVIKQYRSTVNPYNSEFVEWASDGGNVHKLSSQDGYKTRELETTMPVEVANVEQTNSLRVPLSSVEISRPSPVRSGSGAGYQIRGVTFKDKAAFEEWAGVENVSDVFFKANVDDDGFVRSYQLRYVVSKPEGKHVFNRRVEYGNVGNTTVSQPLWWDENQWLVGANGGGESTIATANAAARANQSLYISRHREVRENKTDYQSRHTTERFTGQLGVDAGHYRTTVYVNNSTEQTEYEAWANGTVRVERHRDGQANAVELVTDESGNPVDPARTRRVNPLSEAETETLLTSIAFDNVSVHGGGAPSGDNRIVYVLQGNSVADRDAFAAMTGDRNVSNLTAGIGVSRSGAILGYSLEYSIQRAGETYYVRQYYSVGQVGNTTVERPSWVETALGEGGDATPESAS